MSGGDTLATANPEAQPVTVIGPGRHGTAIAVLLARHGHPVTLHHHNPAKAERASAAVRAAAPGARVSVEPELARAAAASEVIVLATLWNAPQRAVLGTLGDAVRGSVILDISNPLDVTPGGIRFAHPEQGSAGGFVASLLPKGTGHVKVFSNMGTALILEGADLEPPAVLPFLADSDATSTRIRPLLASIGWQPWLLGGIERSAEMEIGGVFNTATGARGKGLLTAAEYQQLTGGEAQAA